MHACTGQSLRCELERTGRRGERDRGGVRVSHVRLYPYAASWGPTGQVPLARRYTRVPACMHGRRPTPTYSLARMDAFIRSVAQVQVRPNWSAAVRMLFGARSKQRKQVTCDVRVASRLFTRASGGYAAIDTRMGWGACPSH